MSATVSPPFARVLEARREDWNRRFEVARKRWPTLDQAAFTTFLRERVDPVVAAVAALDGGRTLPVATVAYDVGLELVAQRLVGPAARHGWIERAFGGFATALAARIAHAPEILIPALVNAVHALATVPGCRPDDFLSELARLAPLTESSEELLRVGQVLGWRSGLAQYRRGALDVLRELPAQLALEVLRAKGKTTRDTVVASLASDPWFDPSGTGSEPRPRTVRSVGAFRGFGGAFAKPPIVTSMAGELIVHSDKEAFLLCADRYGATFHRIQAAPPPQQPRVELGKELEKLLASHAERGPTTAIARAGTTLALTHAHSHAVTLVALPPS